VFAYEVNRSTALQYLVQIWSTTCGLKWLFSV